MVGRFRRRCPAAGGDDPVGLLADALVGAGTPRVLLAHGRPDGDDQARTLADRLTTEGVACFRVLLPRGLDATTVAAEADDPAGALGGLVRAAAWMGDGPAPSRVEPQPDASPDETPPSKVSPLPAVAADLDVETIGGELRMDVGGRRWRVRGLEHVTRVDALRVNVAVFADDEHLGELFHLDTLDLYTARARASFVHAAAGEVRVSEAVIRRDLGRLLVACEQHLADAATASAPEPAQVVLTDAEEAAALDLLRDPGLAERIVADVERVGVVGEATNVLVAYLAAVSRKLDTPLAVLVQSTSAAGKSSLMEAVLGLVPVEDRVSFSAVTGQALFYVGEHDLAHKVLSVAEEHGAARAAYALKLLQSEGELSIASTGKDAGSGRLVTQTYRVAGPVALFLTTTAVDVDEELANRCIVLAVDEHRDQTRAIHDAQRHRQTLDGLLADTERDRVIKLHHDAQQLLDPVLVANPYAPQLGFPDGATRTRRDHVKYLTLIRAVALLHQHQRPRRRSAGPGSRSPTSKSPRRTSRWRTGSPTTSSAAAWMSWPRRPAACWASCTPWSPTSPATTAWRCVMCGSRGGRCGSGSAGPIIRSAPTSAVSPNSNTCSSTAAAGVCRSSTNCSGTAAATTAHRTWPASSTPTRSPRVTTTRTPPARNGNLVGGSWGDRAPNAPTPRTTHEHPRHHRERRGKRP